MLALLCGQCSGRGKDKHLTQAWELREGFLEAVMPELSLERRVGVGRKTRVAVPGTAGLPPGIIQRVSKQVRVLKEGTKGTKVQAGAGGRSLWGKAFKFEERTLEEVVQGPRERGPTRECHHASPAMTWESLLRRMD